MWRVDKAGVKNTSYLLGSYHQMGDGFIYSLKKIERTLSESDLAVFESVDSSSSKVIDLMNQREPDFAYNEELKKSDLRFLKEYIKDWSVPIEKLSAPKLLYKLQQRYMETQRGTVRPSDQYKHFDDYLIHLAKKNNIALKGLETGSVQMKSVNRQFALSWEDAKKPVHTLGKTH